MNNVITKITSAVIVLAMVLGMVTKLVPNDVAIPILTASAAVLVPQNILEVLLKFLKTEA